VKAPEDPRKKVLLVEDERITQLLTRRWLQDVGYEVIMTGDGGAVAGLIEKEEPALILLDLGLDSEDPFGSGSFDGLKVMRWLRRRHRSGAIAAPPVIVVSGQQGTDMKRRVLEAGALAYFRKPADKWKLLTAIQVAVE